MLTDGPAITVKKCKPAKSYGFCFREAFTKLGEPVKKTTFIDILDLAKLGMYDIYYKIVPSSDIVLCIFCEGWPSCAREWITRQRRWPDVNSVEEVTKGGFHIVPKCSPEGDFRLSFSCAENVLIQTLTPLQHKVMKAFKAAIKYHQNTWSPNLQEVISSYHLKTIAFWHFEKSSQELWSEGTLIHHLVMLFEELAEALTKQYLPMYFMPKVNILRNNEDLGVLFELVENILQISRNFRAISEAVKKASLSRYFKAHEHEFKIFLRELKAEGTPQVSDTSLRAMGKAFQKYVTKKH